MLLDRQRHFGKYDAVNPADVLARFFEQTAQNLGRPLVRRIGDVGKQTVAVARAGRWVFGRLKLGRPDLLGPGYDQKVHAIIIEAGARQPGVQPERNHLLGVAQRQVLRYGPNGEATLRRVHLRQYAQPAAVDAPAQGGAGAFTRQQRGTGRSFEKVAPQHSNVVAGFVGASADLHQRVGERYIAGDLAEQLAS